MMRYVPFLVLVLIALILSGVPRSEATAGTFPWVNLKLMRLFPLNIRSVSRGQSLVILRITTQWSNVAAPNRT
jgi:hypothetical protein